MQNRSLTVLVDQEEIVGLDHVRLSSRYSQSLFPYPFFLRIWNAPESVFHRLQRAKHIQVQHEETVLAVGDLVEVTREVVPEGNLITVTFALGYHFWSSWVSLSVAAGATAADTVRQLLSAAGSSFQLLTDPPHNPTFPRAQTFFGSLPEAISSVLSACEVKPYLLPAGIALLPAEAPITETVLDLDSVSGPWILEENTNPRT